MGNPFAYAYSQVIMLLWPKQTDMNLKAIKHYKHKFTWSYEAYASVRAQILSYKCLAPTSQTVLGPLCDNTDQNCRKISF